MRRKFVFVLSVLLLLFTFSFIGSKQVSADEEIAGKIVFHYQLWDGDYSSAGLWCWDTGTGGSQAPVTSTVTDDFGAVYEVNIGSDAPGKAGIIALRKDITLDSRWDYRETPDGENFFIDTTPITTNAVEEIHIYYFQGGYQTYYQADPSKVNIFVLYYDPTAGYEADLGLHSWGTWENESLNGVNWATPAKVFTDGFKSPADVKGKVALLQIDEANIASSGFLIYAGTDETKKTPENACLAITDYAELKNGAVKTLYVSGKNAYYGATATKDFADKAFKFDFVGFNQDDLSGTYAVDPKTIFTKFTLALATKEVTGKETVEKTRIVKVPQLKEGSKPYVQTDKTFTTVSELPELAEGSIGRVVLHYQNWNGDYTGHGTWSWNRGGSFTAGTAMLGVDSFGAVIDLQIATDAADSIGFIAIKGNILADTGDWPGDTMKDSGDLSVDVTSIKNGTTDRIDVYYFSGGSQVFVKDEAKVNILVCYYDKTGKYEEKLGFYSWGNWTNEELQGQAWGDSGNLFVDGFKSPTGIVGKVALLQAASCADSGFLIYAGADDSKKTPNNASESISGLAECVPGDVRVLYVSDKACYDGPAKKGDFASLAFVEIEWVDGEEKYNEEVDVLEYIDFTKRFKVLQGTTEVKISGINFNKTSDTTNEFVLLLESPLDSSKEYKIVYDNGLTESLQNKAEIKVEMDTEAPVITLVSDEAITVKQGEKWDALFPAYRVTDNRDSNLQKRVYVKQGAGTLNTNVAGDYPITLVVEDIYGNVGELTFNITVTPIETGCSGETLLSIFTSLSLVGLALFFFRRKVA